MHLRRYLRWTLGWLRGLLLRIIYLTLRVSVSGERPNGACLITFWHGEQLCLYGGLPKGDVVAPVSRSKDGDIQVGVLSSFGVESVRGSSSSGGLRVLRGLVRLIRAQYSVLFAVDGPRGPIRVPKLGAFYLSQRLNVPIVPVVSKCNRSYVLRQTWDQMRIPSPFARVIVTFGNPIVPGGYSDPESMRKAFIVAMRALTSDNAR